MTIDQAIAVLNVLLEADINAGDDDAQEGLKLGIEALKQVKDCRSGEVLNPGFVLPSETKK